MKTLYLLRHAKSDWSASYGADHDRPLNRRGERAAERIGRFLSELNEVPARVLTSSALRARSTVERAAEAGAWATPIEVDSELYGTDAASVLERLRSQPRDLPSILLVGHQPTWSHTVGRLIGGARVEMPTAGLARIDFAVAWREIEFGAGGLAWLVRPKILPSGAG